MKKLLLVSLVLVTLLVGCGSNQTKNEIKYVETTEIMKKLDNKESFIMVVGNTTCAACIAYKPTLEQLVQNKELNCIMLSWCEVLNLRLIAKCQKTFEDTWMIK